MKLCIFEDSTASNFFPLTYMRPVFELRCGCTRLFEKIQATYPDAECSYLVRDYMADVTKERYGGSVNDLSALGDDTLFVSGRYLDLGERNFTGDGEKAGICDGAVVYLRASKATIEKHKDAPPDELVEKIAADVPHEELDVTMMSYSWNLIHHNPETIVKDFNRMGKSGVQGTLHELSAVYGPEENVYVAPTAVVDPCVVLDTREGPVILEEGVKVDPFTRIQGPAYIGANTQLFGAKIREGCSIGPVCRVGGEVEEAIMHSHSNKYHDGFLGHAYVCQWVNLGALTTNSDLKNDYGTVEVYLNGELTDTGDTKVGCFIGDHTKTSIGSIMNTGTVVGMMDNLVFDGSLFPKFVTSFVWFINGKPMKGAGIKSMLETARTAMGRRKVEMSEAEETLIRYIFDLTKQERREAIKKGRQGG